MASGAGGTVVVVGAVVVVVGPLWQPAITKSSTSNNSAGTSGAGTGDAGRSGVRQRRWFMI
jgi:hypothetical protein